MKVLVVDDHILFREGLVSLLSADPSFKVVGQAGSVCEAVELARTHKPDLVLMDFSLPDGDGAEASALILEDLPECDIVFLTMHDADEKLFAAIRSGAKGYLLKNVPVSKLLSALHSIEKGEAAISRSMTMRILDEFSHTVGTAQENRGLLNNLSPREIEILTEIGMGASNNEIAERLFLSVNTVKHHAHNIFSKLGLKNRREAMNFARTTRLVKKS
jgi:DNA-binding NarL/FixJ family response regulator